MLASFPLPSSLTYVSLPCHCSNTCYHHLGLVWMLLDSSQSTCVGVDWIGVKFSSSSTSIHLNTCGLMRIRLHPNKALPVIKLLYYPRCPLSCFNYALEMSSTESISAFSTLCVHWTCRNSIRGHNLSCYNCHSRTLISRALLFITV